MFISPLIRNVSSMFNIGFVFTHHSVDLRISKIYGQGTLLGPEAHFRPKLTKLSGLGLCISYTENDHFCPFARSVGQVFPMFQRKLHLS